MVDNTQSSKKVLVCSTIEGIGDENISTILIPIST